MRWSRHRKKKIYTHLEKARSAQFASASLYKVKHTKVRIVSEVIQDSVDPPRVMPLVGPSQVHHVHYKLSMQPRHTDQLDWPTPHTTVDEDCKEVVYIDHDHLHLVNQSGDPKPPASPKIKSLPTNRHAFGDLDSFKPHKCP